MGQSKNHSRAHPPHSTAGSRRKTHGNSENSSDSQPKKSGRKGTKRKIRKKKQTLREEIETAKEKSTISRHIPHGKPQSKQDEKDQKNGDRKKTQHRKLTKKDRPKLTEGTEIRCNEGIYIIQQLLGSGGFGDVYKAKKIGTTEFYAIKTELNEFNGKKIDRLKVVRREFF
ncbi:unnamed protein product [Anisakis simplex]|uniref:Protein kinase domain-containing protein n=1 Tax=Anisakis simplex TaxID=6269 RepID=A0A0M3K4T2_ANISI|nr:unnamed protein product [Anisakis simplex]